MKDPFPKTNPDEFVPFNYPIKSKKTLIRMFEKKKSDFLEIVLSRKSERNFNCPSLEHIAELLYYSNKIDAVFEDNSNYLLTKRTAPSAGARHPIDLLISLPKIGTERTLEYYNPIDHSLNELSLPKGSKESFFKEISDNLWIENSCVIWFSIQRDKTESGYENSESLYWRDAGALLYCIQLVSTYLGLKTCPLGTLVSNSFYGLFESDRLISGGGILIGT